MLLHVVHPAENATTPALRALDVGSVRATVALEVLAAAEPDLGPRAVGVVAQVRFVVGAEVFAEIAGAVEGQGRGAGVVAAFPGAVAVEVAHVLDVFGDPGFFCGGALGFDGVGEGWWFGPGGW